MSSNQKIIKVSLHSKVLMTEENDLLWEEEDWDDDEWDDDDDW